MLKFEFYLFDLDIMTTQAKLFFIDVFYQICRNENLFAKRVRYFITITFIATFYLFFNFLKSVNESKYNWLACKVNLANCFPEILIITNSINFESKLSNCLSSLMKDRNEKVRVAVVSKIIEVT